MSEMSTEENEQLVSRIYEKAMHAVHNKLAISELERVVFAVELMMQEVNSGASYEQYFRWATVKQIKNIVGHLQQLGLTAVAELTEKAIAVAFPSGIPPSDKKKSGATEWTLEQEDALGALFSKLEKCNGQVTNSLGAYARSADANLRASSHGRASRGRS